MKYNEKMWHFCQDVVQHAEHPEQSTLNVAHRDIQEARDVGTVDSATAQYFELAQRNAYRAIVMAEAGKDSNVDEIDTGSRHAAPFDYFAKRTPAQSEILLL